MASKRGKRSVAAKRGGEQSTTKSPASSPSKRSKQSTTPMGDKHEETDEKFWEDIYEEEGMHFAEAEPTSSLVNYVKKLEAGKKKEEVRVLVPFCGMSTDMKWLAEQGYTVVGTELVKKAVKKFFDTNKLKYSEEKGKDFNVFKADDLPLKIYQGDMFKFTSDLEPPFNAVWDSHAMHAVNEKDQKRYADTLKKVMAPDCHFLIDSMQYDLKDVPEGFHDHPHPHLVTPEDVLKLFGKEFQLEKLESVDKTMDWNHMVGDHNEAKGQGDDAAKGKGKGKQGKKGQGQGKKEFKYKAELHLMTRKPTKK